MSDEGLTLSQIYNADETGMFRHSVSKNTQVRRGEDKSKGEKSSKERLSVLVGCNATGMHRLKLAVVGKLKNPRAFRGINIEQSLPKKAWFNQAIFTDWFLLHFVPEVRKYQEVLKIALDNVPAVLVLDNAPAHPSEEKLVSRDGKIKVLYLPPNTTSVIQPMNQGIICALKRYYVRHYLNEVLTVI